MLAVSSLLILFDLSGTPTGVLRLLDRFEFLAVKNVLIGILSLVGALFVYLYGGGIWGFLVVGLVSSILGSVLLVFMAFIALRQRGLIQYWRVPIKNWKPFLRFSMWMYATSTVDIPVKRFDIIIVSSVISLEAAGIYKIIKQVLSLMDLLVDPVYQAIYPQFATMVAHNDSKGAMKYSLKISSMLLAICGLMSLVLAVTSAWWLKAIFGEGFAIGVLPLNFFLFLRVVSIATIAIHPLFNAMGYVKQNALILLIANGIYLALAWQLGPRIGLLGLAFAYGFQFSLIVGLKAISIARKGFEQNPASL
jgi:O-antigen/teichoic acid export membrane protein